jgi:hypothetical protein
VTANRWKPLGWPSPAEKRGGIVAQDRAVFWLCVVVLLGAGILVGQVQAVMVAAMTGIILAYYNDRISRP